MKMSPVESSHIKAVGYDEATNTLAIEFSQATYEYYNVPKIVYDELMNALSKGSYIATRIAKAYNYSKIKEA